MAHLPTSGLRAVTFTGAGLLVLVLASCGDTTDTEDGAEDPEAALEQYWDAIEEGNPETACALSHSDHRGGLYADWDEDEQQACIDELDDLSEWLQQEPDSGDVDTVAQVFSKGDTEIHEQDNGEARIHHIPAADDYPMGPTLYDAISVNDHWYLDEPDPLPISAEF
ncbi:hypothetical protein [Nesterenkonia populi]|uniref:hypothetical protein n=1 Tax=Nesterenkonia populi TaxID=1591087 RepID=UPI0011BEFDA2|nr:hypothetical protein [Nesterenkonia populi]